METPPGAQAQVDWGEFAGIDLGDGPQTLYGFVLVLSHARKGELIQCRRLDRLAWQHAHTEAFRRLGGIPAVLRIDNLKTGVGRGAGPWGEVNAAYLSYAKGLGCHSGACLPRCPEDKGVGPAGLQGWTDEELCRWAHRRVCPATGDSVAANWRAEPPRLRPLPAPPLVPDAAVERTVQKDCTIGFEGRTYSVPFLRCGRRVEVRGCTEVVQILDDGQVVAEHPRHSRARLLLAPSHYGGAGDGRVMPPVPLGQMGQRLQELEDLLHELRKDAAVSPQQVEESTTSSCCMGLLPLPPTRCRKKSSCRATHVRRRSISSAR